MDIRILTLVSTICVVSERHRNIHTSEVYTTNVVYCDKGTAHASMVSEEFHKTSFR
jgi:hypothetical protein